jgi:hypothetical protein
MNKARLFSLVCSLSMLSMTLGGCYFRFKGWGGGSWFDGG